MATLTIEHGASPVMQSKTIHNYTYVERKPHIKTITYDYDILTNVVGTRPTYNYTPLDPNEQGNQYARYNGICYLERPITSEGIALYPLANEPIQFVDAGENSYYLAPNNLFTDIQSKVRDVILYTYERAEEDEANHRTTTYLYLIPIVQPTKAGDYMERYRATVMDTPYQYIGQPNEFTHTVKYLAGNPPELTSFPYGEMPPDGDIPSLSYASTSRTANWVKDGETWIERKYKIEFTGANLANSKSATNVSDVFDGIQAWYLSGRSTLGYTAQLTEYNEATQEWDDVGNPSTGTVSLSSAPDPLIVLQQSGTANVTNYNVSLSYEEVTT